MFFFTKNKPVLKDLIPNGHIDIHSHLLAGIDDGAKDFADTIALTQALQSFGITEFITTPHIIQHVWENTPEIIQANEAITLKELSKNNINVPFRAAAEYLMDEQFSNRVATEALLPLKGNHVLVEMSYINPPIQLYSILFDLQIAGYIPVLAHPERYLFFQNNLDEYTKLKTAGCLFQLNLLSVVGYYGEGVTRIAEYLLKKGMYNYVGSDVHHERHIAAFDQKVKIKDLVPLQEAINNNQFFKTI